MTSYPLSATSSCLHSEDFTAYCDEFGSPQDTERRTMGVAGLLAPSDKWSVFADHWDSYLTLEKVPQPFHMKDFVHHSKAFSKAAKEHSIANKPPGGGGLNRTRVQFAPPPLFRDIN